MADYPWGDNGGKTARNKWLKDNNVYSGFKELVKSGVDEKEALKNILSDFDTVKEEASSEAVSRENWLWAFTNSANDYVTAKDAPNEFSWALLVQARKDPTLLRNVEVRVAKDLFGGDDDDDDTRALVKTGVPAALRKRFSGFLGETKQFLSRELPSTVGCS